MKSPLVATAAYIPDDEKPRYSDLKVCQSGAGFYIGTDYNNPDGYLEPGSRESGYFDYFNDADKFLKTLEGMVEPGIVLHQHRYAH